MKQATIKKIIANSNLFSKGVLEKMEISQINRLADYLIPKKLHSNIENVNVQKESYRMDLRLQVFKDGKWEYVFCHNRTQGIITTKDVRKALKPRDLDYFVNHFANNEFRVA